MVQSQTVANGDSADVPITDLGEASVLIGLGYTVSTNVTAVSAGNYLVAELANPMGSGVNLVMTSRVLSSNVANGAAPPEYARYVSTATLAATPTPTSVSVNNRISGGPASSATFRFQMTSTLPSGATNSGGFLPTGGEEKRIKDIIVIPPGGKLIYAIGGSGGGLAATARVVMTFLFFAQTI